MLIHFSTLLQRLHNALTCGNVGNNVQTTTIHSNVKLQTTMAILPIQIFCHLYKAQVAMSNPTTDNSSSRHTNYTLKFVYSESAESLISLSKLRCSIKSPVVK